MVLLGPYLVAALLLVGAGAAKAVRPYDTARALAASLPWWPRRGGATAVRAAAGAEALLGVAALVWPARPLAAAVAASYAAFTGFVLLARARGGPLATCGCFGSPDTPPTRVHVAVDALCLAGAVGVAVAAPAGALPAVLARQYGAGVPVAGAALLGAWLAYLALVPLARLGALRAMAPPGARPPTVPAVPAGGPSR